MSHLEPLPENCPSEEAEEIAVTRVVYRLVRSIPPVLEDFHSQRADCGKTLKLPRFRAHHVCKVALEQGARRIQQTFQPSHPTGWLLADYDILAPQRGGTMKSIRYFATLFYYDGIQIFEARDAIGGHYVALMVEPAGDEDRSAGRRGA